jgi:hypothetical protein
VSSSRLKLVTSRPAGLIRATALVVMAAAAALALAACGQRPAGPANVTSASLPRGVISAQRACDLVVRHARPGTFAGIDWVHLVLTTYGKGEPLESNGDYSAGMPRNALVWVVEVHARIIHMTYSRPPGAHPMRLTDFSEVMNARTGRGTDFGLGHSSPLPMSKLGPMVSLPARC